MPPNHTTEIQRMALQDWDLKLSKDLSLGTINSPHLYKFLNDALIEPLLTHTDIY